MKFSAPFIEEVKARCPIEDVVSSYVTLKRAGSRLSGLCPFHSEKTPSFSVSPENNLFYCFGCGAGGDTVTFVMKAEGVDYPGAIELLAKRAGIPIPDSEEEKGGIKRERILKMNTEAARFFHRCLIGGGPGLDYLMGRGLTMPIIKRFGLGYAPDQFGALTNHLASLGFTTEEMKTGFLCGISKKNGKPYDYFRGRVIFPIIDISGDVVAFGGRIIGEGEPKYLNSSDTPVFLKRRNVFALNYARKHAENGLILCEGYMDVIALHAAGFENAVATLGTAITPDHARIMKRYTNRVIIAYDADEAGQRAAEKAFGILGEAGIETKRLKVEGAKDPDEYIRKFGADKFRYLMEGSRSQFEFRFSRILSKYNVELPEDRIKAAADFVTLACEFHSASEREVYLARASEVLHIPIDSLRGDLERRLKKKQSEAKKEMTRQVIRQTEGYGDRINPDRIKNPKAAGAEDAILGILMIHPEKVRLLRAVEPPFTKDDFFTEFGKRVYDCFLSLYEREGRFDQGMLGEYLSTEEMGRITHLAMNRIGLGNEDEKILTDSVRILRQEQEQGTMSLEDLIQSRRGEGSGV